MPDTPIDFAALMSRVELGDEDAEQELISRYGHHILSAIRRRLPDRMRAQCDSQDFCQAVWASFFARRGEFARFKSHHELLLYLGGVAGNKVVDEIRRQIVSQKRNARRECSLDESTFHFEQTLPGKMATPSQMAVAHEQIERLIDGRPQKHRRILELRAAGVTYKEIARQIDMDERNVRRVIERIERQIGK
jgi:RNA polymerase sigma-70 factor (ECF subfamily)